MVGAVIAISFELLAMSLTWIKTVYVVRQFKRSNTAGSHVVGSVAKVMLYNGTTSSLISILTTGVLNEYKIPGALMFV